MEKAFRNRRKTTKWNLIFQYVLMSLTILKGFLLVPLYLKFIPIEIYGLWLASGNILGWLTAIDPGLSTVMQQKIGWAYGEESYDKIGKLITSGFIINIIIVFLMMIVGLATIKFLPGWLKFPDTINSSNVLKPYTIAIISTCLMFIYHFLFAINKGLQSSIGIGIINTSISLSSIALILILLFNNYGLMAIALAFLYESICSILAHSIYLISRFLNEKIKFMFSVKEIPELFKLITFTFFARIAGILSNNIDLIIVTRFLGPESVAALNFTRRAFKLLYEFFQRAIIAFMPATSHLVGSGEHAKTKSILIRLSFIFVWITGFTSGALGALNDDFVRLWVGSKLFLGYKLNFILCAWLVNVIIALFFENFCFVLGDIKGNSIVRFIRSLFLIPAMYIGVKIGGIVGIIFLPLIFNFLITMLYFPKSFSRLLTLTSKDHFSILSEVLRTVLITMPISMLFSKLIARNWIVFIMLSLLYILLYITTLYFVSKNAKHEINSILTTLKLKFS